MVNDTSGLLSLLRREFKQVGFFPVFLPLCNLGAICRLSYGIIVWLGLEGRLVDPLVPAPLAGVAARLYHQIRLCEAPSSLALKASISGARRKIQL